MNSPPIRVLLADDDEDDFVITQDLLADVEGKRFQLDWLGSYDAALQTMVRNAHDVCLVDYRFGERNGLELLREAIRRGCRAPIIMLTGQGDRKVDLEAMQAGAADYVVKGWNATDLERSIRYAIEHKQAEEALRRMQEELEQRVRERTAELAEANQTLQASLREKEVLLREIHHRVKNNLQLISSLLKLQAPSIQDPRALELFEETQGRVQSMALIHEKLYRFKDLARIDFADYVRSLADQLIQAYGVEPEAIALELNVDHLLLGIDAVVPCALILHELIANAFKHAFPKGKGRIAVRASAGESRQFVLSIQDDGIGFPPDLDIRRADSLGLQLVAALVDQLDGAIEVARSPGTRFTITFPVRNGS